jgi:hypothetical protein
MISEETPALPEVSDDGHSQLSISAIIPCYNELAAIEVAYREIKAAMAG